MGRRPNWRSVYLTSHKDLSHVTDRGIVHYLMKNIQYFIKDFFFFIMIKNALAPYRPTILLVIAQTSC